MAVSPKMHVVFSQSARSAPAYSCQIPQWETEIQSSKGSTKEKTKAGVFPRGVLSVSVEKTSRTHTGVAGRKEY